MQCNWAQQLVFIDSTDGNKPSACFHTSPCWLYWEMEAMLVEKGDVVRWILNINCCRLPQWDHMGSGCGVCQRGSMGRMLHIGCECWDGASVSLTQLSNASVQCSPCFHPSSIPPPPLSSSNKWSFCSSVFAAVGWRASAGPSPKTSGLHWNSFLCTL